MKKNTFRLSIFFPALALSAFLSPAVFAQSGISIDTLLERKLNEKAELQQRLAQIEAEEQKLLELKQQLEEKSQQVRAAAANVQKIQQSIVVPDAQDDPSTKMTPTTQAVIRQAAATAAAAQALSRSLPQATTTTNTQPTTTKTTATTTAPATTNAQTTTATVAKQPDINPQTASLRSITSSGRQYVNLYDVAKVYGLTYSATKTGGMLTGKNGLSAVFSTTQREGSLCTRKTFFLFPMINVKNVPYISRLDLVKVIDPVFRSKSIAKLGMKTIMIDPGHGGKDPGALYGKYQEKALNLQIATKLKKKLESLGFTVVMTRTGDTFPELSDRTNLCAKVKPDLFISIHCNASSNSTAINGVETYSVTPVGASSTSGSTIEKVQKPANAYEVNSTRLAHEIHSSVIKATGAADRGIRKGRLYVVTNTTCPSILLEVGYISCPTEAAKIGTDAYQNKIVTGILNGLAGYGLFLK